ncbi:Hypothetical predicted protein [Paramuricea clavata]|uniref:Uncharacterized protein n=1 Tax=Paramuricea clavata TaxID=317549 RepID=A0A6S7G075_PARCT|nr:Hypothetical predicted protein [Paramuricea clavata]
MGSWIEDLKYAEYWRKFNISEDSEKNRDNSGNHPHTSMRECKDVKVYKRDSDRNIFTVRFVIANIKLKIEQLPRTMKTATLLAFLLLELASTYAVTAEEEVVDDEPAAAKDVLIEDDKEETENDEEQDKEKRNLNERT